MLFHARVAAIAALLWSLPVGAATVTVHPGQSIQTAIDAAGPGSTILVLPGTYHENGWPHAVTVTKDDIHLIARPRPGHPVVIEQAADQDNGIWVSPTDTLEPADPELPPCGESGQRIHHFEVQGFTVQGFPGYGIYLACVEDFTIRKNTAAENRTYSIFPVRSRVGRVTHNTTSGTFTDACVYVGESEDVLVDHNSATDCQIGLQLENTHNVRLERNRSTGNTAGLIVDVIANRQILIAADNTVSRNLIANNNRPSTGEGSGTEALVPGIGVVINGADRTLLSRNVIKQHDLAGLVLVNFCIEDPVACADPGLTIDPYPDGNRVLRNRFVDDETNVIFIPGTGTENCFANNKPSPLLPDVTLPPCS
jgi:nitrous oxidase accessory protein NosD